MRLSEKVKNMHTWDVNRRVLFMIAADIEQLEKALEPFAHEDLCETTSGNVEGDNSPVFGKNNAILRLGDFRKARRLLGL